MWPLAVVAMAARQRETPIAHKRTTHTNAKRRHSFHDPFHEPKANARITPSTWEKSIETRTDDLRITRRLTAVHGRPDGHTCPARPASRYARVRGSPGSLLATTLAWSARDHRSGGSLSRPRRARVGPRSGRTPGGCAVDDYLSAFHLRLPGRRSCLACRLR